jgi:small subunit ribosomal protein S20
MPVLKSAKKRMRQNLKRRARNFPVRSELKSLIKKIMELIKDGKLDEANKFLPKVYSIIDMACKKKIIHPNNAARKKSLVARGLNNSQSKGGKKVEGGEVAEKEAKVEKVVKAAKEAVAEKKEMKA